MLEPLGGGDQRGVDDFRNPPLLVDALFILDFLCIHPFRDGNGRVSRLLTSLVLSQHGYAVPRYISLERLIGESKQNYYEVLRQSSARWHAGEHDWRPWVNFQLSIIHRAYRLFEERAGEIKMQPGAKRSLIESAIESLNRPFILTKLELISPGVSRDMVRLVLREMTKARKVRCVGREPGAKLEKRYLLLKEGKRRGNDKTSMQA